MGMADWRTREVGRGRGRDLDPVHMTVSEYGTYQTVKAKSWPLSQIRTRLAVHQELALGFRVEGL